MGRIFKRSLEHIKENRERRLSGLDNCIPFTFDRLGEYLPGVQRKNYAIITANSGIGKSKMAKKLYVIDVVNYIEQHPETDMKIDIKYFCLEESKEQFINSIISYKLFVDHDIRLSTKEIESIKKGYILQADALEKIEAMDSWFDFFEAHVEVIDEIRNPYGIFHHVEQFMLQNGEWSMRTMHYGDKEVTIRDNFTHTHPQHYVIVVIDHISLVQPEKGMSGKHEAIGKISSEYLVKLRDKYLCSICVVQQQAADQEKKQYTYKGQNIESKLEPSLDGLGDNKMTQRDADEVLGLFAPDRYEISEHRRYDIVKLQDNYRSGLILKSRYGTSNIRIGFLFNGAVGQLTELPKASQMTEEDYEEALNSCGRTQYGQRTFNFG